MVGADFSPNAVAFCRRAYPVEGLEFVEGNAEALPFDEESFDAVVNVESSHCYGSMAAFLGQVRRVLREGGHFLYADFRDESAVGELKLQLRDSGMALVREADITPNVVRALDLDSERKIARIRALVHGPLVGAFLQFAGTQGSDIYEEFRRRQTVYMSFVLRKGASGAR
jgi:ubiquinone/menaquinone biosynthesis C-methylase UbiE